MLQAYVGIITRRGLEVFCPEYPQTVRFLQRRVERTRGHALCFWSVAADEAVAQVQAALRCGEPRAALRLLEQATRAGGPLLPFQSETTDMGVVPSDS
jgi:hypothetical protein